MEHKSFGMKSVFARTEEGYLENISFSVEPGKVIIMMVPEKSERDTLVMTLIGTMSIKTGTIYLNDEDITDLSCVNRLEKGLLTIFSIDEERRFITDRRILQESSIGYTKLPWLDPWNSIPWMGEKKEFSRFRKTHGIYKKGTTGSLILIVSFDSSRAEEIQIAQRQFLYTLMEMKSRGTAIVLVTNILEEVLCVADQVCMIKNGRIVGFVNNEDHIQKEIRFWERKDKLGE